MIHIDHGNKTIEILPSISLKDEMLDLQKETGIVRRLTLLGRYFGDYAVIADGQIKKRPNPSERKRNRLPTSVRDLLLYSWLRSGESTKTQLKIQ